MFPCFNEATAMVRGTLETDIVNAAKAGFRHMEIRKEKLMRFLNEGHKLPELKMLLEDNGIKPICINALAGFSFRKGQSRADIRDLCSFLCYAGQYVGCRDLEVIASFGVPTDDEDEIAKETAESLSELGSIARTYDMRLALEYMGVPKNSVRTFRQALDIVNMVGMDNVGLLPDTWHHYAGGSKPEDILLARGDQIFTVHLSDCPTCEPFTVKRAECWWPGDGAAPITDMLRNLKAVGYDDIVSIEIFDPAIQGMDVNENIPLAYEKARAALEKAGVLS